MNYATVLQNINYVRESIASVIQTDNVVSHDREVISWARRKPGIMTRTYYPIEYQSLIDNQQYSFLLSDGSFFQFFYDFDSQNAGELRAARLAFYPPPVPTREDIDALQAAAENSADYSDEILFEHLSNCIDLLDVFKIHPANTGHFRFDYDPRAEAAHAVSHLQFSGVNNVRVSASFFPLPSAFIQIVATAVPNLPALSAICIGHSRNGALRIDVRDELISLSHAT